MENLGIVHPPIHPSIHRTTPIPTASLAFTHQFISLPFIVQSITLPFRMGYYLDNYSAYVIVMLSDESIFETKQWSFSAVYTVYFTIVEDVVGARYYEASPKGTFCHEEAHLHEGRRCSDRFLRSQPTPTRVDPDMVLGVETR